MVVRRTRLQETEADSENGIQKMQGIAEDITCLLAGLVG